MHHATFPGMLLLAAGALSIANHSLGAGEPVDCGVDSVIQYINPEWSIGGGCLTPQGNASRATSWARAYSPSEAFTVHCVEFGCINYDEPWEVTVNLLLGNPAGPYHDLTLLDSRTVTVPNNASDVDRDPIVVSFAGDGEFPRVLKGQTLVVEVVSASREISAGGDGGTLVLGFNQGGETAPSYYRSDACGVPEYESTADLLGEPAWAWILSVHGTSSTCSIDLTGDGMVNGADLGVLLTSWGPSSDSHADFTGDNRVDGADLGILLNAWGSCR